MEEYTSNAVVNRNEPIPVVSPPGQGDGANDPKSNVHQHKRSGSTGRSLQDRLLTKYVA